MSTKSPAIPTQPPMDEPRPLPPPEPQLEDCCGSGCTICVFDAYEMARERYAIKLAAWQALHPHPD